MQQPVDKVESDRQLLMDAQSRGLRATLGAYMRLSGPGWLQSAITLGGGSLASSLIMGVLAGSMFLWVQPLAMILGIIMLSAIAYVTTTTQQRPFQAINRHVSPVLGWGWLLASLAANMFWCLPQYALASGVLETNLLPELLGPEGSIVQSMKESGESGSWVAANAAKLLIVGAILLLTTTITWAYDGGNWGIKAYEFILKMMVGGIVICFVGVLFAIRQEVSWGELLLGFIPTWSSLTQPSQAFQSVLTNSEHAVYWAAEIVSQQHDVIISAAATAVGINMTFFFPYSMLAKGWTREFRGLAKFDLSTGMFIPYVLATSCIVVAAANQLHTQPVPGFLGETDESGQLIVANEKAQTAYYSTLEKLLVATEGRSTVDSLKNQGPAELRARLDQFSETDRRVAAMLVERSPFDLARALSPLTGQRVANLIFGLGVLGMALSTITLLMLISGFCICEALNIPSKGWPHRLSTLAAATGALGPFIWSKASFYLAVYVSSFGLMLIPIAYWSFFFMMNNRALLGADLPTGGRRFAWNSLMLIAAGIATAASIYSVYKKLGMIGLGVLAGFVAAAIIVQLLRSRKSTMETPSDNPA